jgi:hypothetical protein
LTYYASEKLKKDTAHDGRFRVRRPRSSDVIGFTHTATRRWPS